MSIYQELAELESRGEQVALCTIVETDGSVPRHPGSKMLVFADGSIRGTVGGGEVESRVVSEAQQALRDGKPRLLHYRMVDPQQGDPGVCGGQLEVYIEPVIPRPTIVVIGGGHVGRAVVHLAHWLGFRVVVSDDRPDFCTPDAVPDADEYYPVAMAQLPDVMRITPQTYLILTTRGSGIDVAGLPALLKTPARFIGIIGSKRRWITTRDALLEAGMPVEEVDRVHSPVGLEIHAETPEEIAVSILAEVMMVRREATGEPMKH